MKTNYQNLNLFEAAAVTMVFVGIYIIGLVLLCGLGLKAQNHVSTALNIFDMHEAFDQSLDELNQGVRFVFDTEQEYFNQFYIAFGQVAVIPSAEVEGGIGTVHAAYEALGSFSDTIALAYNQQSAQPSTGDLGGLVSGVMIDLNLPRINFFRTQTCAGDNLSPPQVSIPYRFAPVDLPAMRSLLLNNKAWQAGWPPLAKNN